MEMLDEMMDQIDHHHHHHQCHRLKVVGDSILVLAQIAASRRLRGEEKGHPRVT